MRLTKTWLYTKIKLLDSLPDHLKQDPFFRGQREFCTELVGILHLLTTNKEDKTNVTPIRRQPKD